MKLRLLLLTLQLLSGFAGMAREVTSTASGLLFSSKTESITQRTSLELSNGKPIRFAGTFSLEFDLSIRDAMRFGYILRLIDQDLEETSLVFVNFRNDYKYYIDFNASRTRQNIPMRIHPDLIGTGKWIPIRLDFDLTKNQALIHIDSTTYLCKDLGLPNPAKLQIVFGFHGINLDVPAMALKNIRISRPNKRKLTIPLNESSGEVVHSASGKAVGTVKNPTWLISEHFNWNPVAEFSAPLASGVAYNSSSNEVYILSNDSLICFQTENRKVTATPIEPIPLRIDEAIYNPKANQTFLYNFNDPDKSRPSIVQLDMETLTISHKGYPHIDNRLHHHNAFFDPEADTLFVFGGYGNFSYSNRLLRYDPTLDDWIRVPLACREDSLYPRFFAASGEGRNDYEILIFGGFGNNSGRQELGGRNLYDLNALDLQNRKIRKLWEISPDSIYVPATNLIVNRPKNCFYTLIYPHHVASSRLRLCRYDLDTGEAEIVSNAIPILSEEIPTKAFLFRNAAMNEFVAVIREYRSPQSADIRIYTLSTPPVSAEELTNYTPSTLFLPILIVGLSLLCGIILYLLARRKLRSKKVFPAIPAVNIAQNAVTDHKRENAVYVLGDFLVFDGLGRDITYRFSAKLRALFALILIHSKETDTGLSSEKLSAVLWPDKEMAEAKNIRGVTINHLRKILDDIPGIKLERNSARWRFVFSENFYCDYIRCMELCRDINQKSASRNDCEEDSLQEPINELIRIISRGPLLPSIIESWMDNERHNVERETERCLLHEIQRLKSGKDYDRILRLANTLFSLDPINETVLQSGISSLLEIERPDLAQILYQHFCSRFKEALGVDYPRPFESIAQRNNG